MSKLDIDQVFEIKDDEEYGIYHLQNLIGAIVLSFIIDFVVVYCLGTLFNYLME